MNTFLNTGDIFVAILFGHVIADFFLQPSWMATKKGSSNWLCFLHCFIYAMCISFCTKLNIHWFLFVFLSHFLVDRFSLADKWLQLIGGRDLEGFVFRGHEGIPKNLNADQKDNYKILRGAFSAICYVIVDNSFHIFSMVLIYKAFFA